MGFFLQLAALHVLSVLHWIVRLLLNLYMQLYTRANECVDLNNNFAIYSSY